MIAALEFIKEIDLKEVLYKNTEEKSFNISTEAQKVIAYHLEYLIKDIKRS